MDSAVICRGSADTASSSMYVVLSLDMWLDEHAELGPATRSQSAPGSVLADITEADADNCSLE